MSRAAPSRARMLAFAALVTVGSLAGLNAAVEMLEDRGTVETHRPDDRVQFVEERLFTQRDDGQVSTTEYAERGVQPATFAAKRGRQWRAFVLGGSFAMDKRGGIASWLRETLAGRYPETDTRIVNLAAAGQDSHRNREIAREIWRFEPDVLLVATCNNEGAPAPGEVRNWLHKQGGYRLLSKYLAPAPPDEERPLYTPQLAQSELIREQYELNLREILDGAGAHGVPVVLATLPANLRYDGLEPMVLGGLPDNDQRACLHQAGIDVDDGRPADAIAVASRCRGFGNADEWLGLAELQAGAGSDGAAALRARWGDCLFDGVGLHYAGDHRAAIEQLSRCDDLAESLRWIGMSHFSLGEAEEARHALDQSIELLPRNRCRPSFNDLIRKLAAEYENVSLLDLARIAEELSPLGIPGRELFVDTCHLNWEGHAAMAGAILGRLEELGLAPPGRVNENARLDVEALRVQWQLPRRDAAGRRLPGP
jgi:tetratricopeptide (TPR) repeat protein